MIALKEEGIMNLSEITVQEFTSPSVITISINDNIDTALELMQQNGIRHLPVMNNQKIVGVLSERDVLAHVGKDWTKMVTAEDIMNPSILSAYENDLLGEVAYQLSSQKKGSAIILDANDNLYGIFTTTDALNALVEILYPLANDKSDLKRFE